MSKNRDNDPDASALVLLFLTMLMVLFLVLEYSDRQAEREVRLLDSLEVFSPEGHLKFEEAPH
jgi:hypothetical protein